MNDNITINNMDKYNLKHIDTEAIKNKVILENTFYAFKKAGKYRLSLDDLKTLFIINLVIAFVFSFVVKYLSVLVFCALFIYGFIFTKEKKGRLAYQKYLREQMINFYKKDLVTLNFIPENIDYKIIQMIDVSADSYDNGKDKLIGIAFDLGADAIFNINHSATSFVSSTETREKNSFFEPKKYQTVTTGVNTNVHMQGIAIKIL